MTTNAINQNLIKIDSHSGIYVTPHDSMMHGFNVSTQDYYGFVVVCEHDNITFDICSRGSNGVEKLCEKQKDSFTYYFSPNERKENKFKMTVWMSEKCKLYIKFM